jgi:hypothetical protein
MINKTVKGHCIGNGCKTAKYRINSKIQYGEKELIHWHF